MPKKASPHSLRATNIPTLVFETSSDASRHVASMIEALIKGNTGAGRKTVLGLPTGSTPIGLYRELIRRHQEEGLDFSNVITFNLDEYFPMQPDDSHSYNYWMRETFFNHVNVPEENIHIPEGTLPANEISDYCDEYERNIREAGGIDLQLLGIGRTGHIGFNEPGSTRNSPTRLVTLDPVTRKDAASEFFGEENVPHQAITMGVGTILDARKVVILAFGEHKAPIVQRAIEGEITDTIAASFLQRHEDATFVLDEAASAEMKEIKTPWLVGPLDWTPDLIRRAVLWLSFTADKPLLTLTDDDFREHDMYQLLREHGPAQRLGEQLFEEMTDTICPHPGGTEPRTVLVFSPHPDDDVISMGGTLIHLVEQNHEVHIAYMTSGNIGVFDHDALRFTDFVAEFNTLFGIEDPRTSTMLGSVRDFLKEKTPGQRDSENVLKIKKLIRETEARAGALSVGIPPEQLAFLDLPFYRTGTIAKNSISDEDVSIVRDIMRRLRPAQIYVAGDLSDPHGTHRQCAQAIFSAYRDWRQGEPKIPPAEVWLYRGAWQEWEPHEIDRVVPLSPNEMEQKILAIFKHQSQKDRAMFPGGSDQREFWKRAEDRNRHTAKLYDQLGLPQFFALEGFVRWSEGLES